MRDDEETGPWQQEEEAGPKMVTQSLSLSKLQEIQKDFSSSQVRPLVPWFLRCWDIAACDLKTDGSEAKQLGYLSWNLGID